MDLVDIVVAGSLVVLAMVAIRIGKARIRSMRIKRRCDDIKTTFNVRKDS